MMTAEQRTAFKKLVIASNSLKTVIRNQDLTVTRNGASHRLAVYLSDIESTVADAMAILYPAKQVTPKSPNYENSEIAFLCR